MIRRGVQASRQQGAFVYGDLWNFWYAALPAGTVIFNSAISDIGDDVTKPTVLGEVFDLAVIADGGWSQLRSKYFTRATPEYAGYVVYRFRVERKYVPGFASEGEYRNGTYATILLNVAFNNGEDWLMGFFYKIYFFAFITINIQIHFEVNCWNHSIQLR